MHSCPHLKSCYVQLIVLPQWLVLCTTMIVLSRSRRHNLQPGEVGKVKRLMLALVSLPLGAAAPSGADIALHGTNHGALPCMACHGTAFQGNPSIGAPPLAGQPSETTLAAFDAIAAGKLGTNTVMQNIAASLTPAERAAVASYFASLKAK